MLFLCSLLGLAHEVIDVSSDSEHSKTESKRQLIRTLLEERRNSNRASASTSTRMSATSPVSDDSNAEKDFEYADDEFLTEPEIEFSLEAESEAEPRRG